MTVPTTSPPTAGDVLERLREEWDELGMLSYHGAPWETPGTAGGPVMVRLMLADLTPDDIAGIRELLRDAAATIEAYS